MINAKDFSCPRATLLVGTYKEDNRVDKGKFIIDPEDSLERSSASQEAEEGDQYKEQEQRPEPMQELKDIGRNEKKVPTLKAALARVLPVAKKVRAARMTPPTPKAGMLSFYFFNMHS